MRLALTGAGGLVGRFIAEAARAAGHSLVILARSPLPGADEHRPYDLLGPLPPLADVDALIHCAFQHVPGRYRGGEGQDPEGFRRANLEGSLRLFEAMRGRRILFLSSRAVFDGYGPGTLLTEAMPPCPESLYGQVKAEAEVALFAEGGASLRATGVYGPGPDHKWRVLFEDFRAGRPIEPRVATEVHGADLAAAALLPAREAGRGRLPCLGSAARPPRSSRRGRPDRGDRRAPAPTRGCRAHQPSRLPAAFGDGLAARRAQPVAPNAAAHDLGSGFPPTVPGRASGPATRALRNYRLEKVSLGLQSCAIAPSGERIRIKIVFPRNLTLRFSLGHSLSNRHSARHRKSDARPILTYLRPRVFPGLCRCSII